MKHLLSIFILLTLFSCGKISPKGTIESRDVKVADFVNLDLKGNFRIFYIKGDSSFINIETYGNIADNLKIKVTDKTLSITEKRPTKDVDFYNITLYSKFPLEKISLTDAAEMNISSEIKTDHFTLDLKKNAKFIGSVNSRRADVEMSGKSRANFRGDTKKAFVKVSDTASLIAPYWLIGDLQINASNGTYAEVNVKDSLKGAVKSTAEFVYYSDPIRAFKIEKTATVENRELE
ncbi:GIN domain-containing protein [Kaistella palustris]|uniref:GIN domain-containing protein n=1 Tax=Kaistella palustris TaxID=493376 RepID=UPI00041BF9D7|nr:DUF2807 domain-containing protein [Kaistella palustris]